MSIPPHSYSSLKLLKTCPYQYWRMYVKKNLPFYESPEMKWGNRVHSGLEHRLRDHVKLPPDMEAHESFCLSLDRFKPEVEIKLGCRKDGTPCDFFAKDVYIRGKLDVVVSDQDRAGLFDWKTGKVFEDPFELRVQALLLRINRPQIVKVTGYYVWLKTGVLGQQHNLSATAITWSDIKLLHERAEQMEQAEDWPKVQNVLCGWCRVHDCEHNPEREAAIGTDTGTSG